MSRKYIKSVNSSTPIDITKKALVSTLSLVRHNSVTLISLNFTNYLYSPQKVTPKHPPQTRLSWYTPQIIELLFSHFSHGFHYPFSFSTFRDFRNCLTGFSTIFLNFAPHFFTQKTL